MSHQNSVRQTPWRSVRNALICVRRWRDLDPERSRASCRLCRHVQSPPLLPNGVTLLRAGGAVSEKCSYLSLSPTTAHFTAHIKRQKNPGVRGTRHPRHQRKKGPACAAGSRPDNCAVSLLFMGRSRLPKDSCGHETADKHTKQAKLFHQGQTLITDVPRRGTSSHTRYYLMPRLVFNWPLLSRSAPGLGASLFNCLLTHRAANSASTDTMRSSFWVAGTPVHRPTLADVWSSFAGHHPHH